MGEYQGRTSIADIMDRTFKIQGYIVSDAEFEKRKYANLAGKSLIYISEVYKKHEFCFFKGKDVTCYHIEIQQADSTILCFFENNICIEAYRHSDSEDEDEKLLT